MATIEHPENERLIAFFENPAEVGQKDLSLHLATCQSCRNQMSALSELKETLKEIATESTLDAPNLSVSTEDLLMQAPVNPENLKAALHFETHRAAMDRALLKAPKKPEQKQKPLRTMTHKNPGFAEIFRESLRLRTPFWITASATAFAGILFIFIFSPFFSADKAQLSIATYQDNAVIQFQEKTARPGIGFFDNARTTEHAFENINIALIKKNTGIALSWPSVENAMGYTLVLQIIQNGEKKIVDEIKTKQPKALFQNKTFEKNTRYEWILKGKTQDDKLFRASGGFIITQKNWDLK